MKKIMLGLGLVSVGLLADVSTILPYGVAISYDKDSAKSAKDSAILAGIYASKGNLGYLTEISYSHLNAKYKDSNISNLVQDDFVISYSKYFKDYMYKIGGHYVNTTDTRLGNGYIVTSSTAQYGYNKYNYKYTYGTDGFFSLYSSAHNEIGESKSLKIVQLSPYISFYKALNLNWGNKVKFKANYEFAYDLLQTDYLSYSVSDMLFYKKYTLTLSAYGGEMRAGVKDGGMSVYNSLDMMKTGYGIKLKYRLKPAHNISLGYTTNTSQEDGMTQDSTNTIISLAYSYSY